MTSSNKAIFQLTTPLSAVRTIWVTAYTTNFKLKPPLVVKLHIWNLPWCGVVSNMTSIELVANWTCCERQQKLKPHRRVFLNHWTSEPRKTVMGWKKMGQFFVLGNAIDGSPPILEMRLGHVSICPCMSQTVILRWFSTWKYINRSISHGSEYCLCIGVEAYFYGWCNAHPNFGIWSK